MARVAHHVTLFTIIDTSPYLHINCTTETCANLGGNICITRALSDYLQTQTRLQQENPAWRGNDREHLTSTNPKVIDALANPKFYRLRFKKHADIAKKYVKYTLLKHDDIWEEEQLNCFWGSKLKTTSKDTRLDLLILRAETQSVGAIYRLHDILDGMDPDPKRLRLIDFLALQFALGHGKDPVIQAESIAELIAGFQFFKAFAAKKQKFYLSEFIRLKKRDVEFEANKKLGAYLLSQECIDEIKKLWTQYQKAYKRYMSDTTLAIDAKNDDDFVRQLKYSLGYAPIQAYDTEYPLHFPGNFETIYHTIKHENDTQKFMKLDHLPPADSMFNYLEMIRRIVHDGTLSKTQPPRPDQFDEARIYTFELITPKNLVFQVFVKHYKGHKTFVLSCYSRSPV